MERLQKLGGPWIHVLLTRQYRMHEDICAFPSRKYYEDRLTTDQSVLDRQPLWYAAVRRTGHRAHVFIDSYPFCVCVQGFGARFSHSKVLRHKKRATASPRVHRRVRHLAIQSGRSKVDYQC